MSRSFALAAALLLAALPIALAAGAPQPATNSSRTASSSSSSSFSRTDYTTVLRLSYLFYDAQRSGKLGSDNPISWRGDSHTSDCVPGGFYDAGDHLKLNFPLATSLAFLAWGVVQFRDAYASSGQLSSALSTIRWGTVYLVGCHTAPEELIGQIGNPGIDHAYWGRPEDQTGPRTCYTWDASKPASDLAAATASALAGGALALREQDSGYADKLISHARQLFDYARKYQGKYSSSYSDATYVYASYGYRDDVALAATLLWKATGEETYLAAAISERAKSDMPDGFFVTWDSVGPLSAAILKCSGKAPAEALTHLDNFQKVWQSCSSNGFKKTPNGLCIAPLGGWGNLRHATGGAFVMLALAKCESDAGKKQQAIQWAKSQVDYALGSSGRSFVVGFGVNYPKNAHHRGSSCPDRPAKCDYDSAFTSTGPNPQLLAGALVGGPPGPGDAYVDERKNYQTNEVAFDYNAAFSGALAGLVDMA